MKIAENNQQIVTNKAEQVHNIGEFKFRLDQFEGPLDLLSELIKNKKISIQQINVLELANQYLDIIQKLQDQDLDIAGEYLVLATRFILMKAKILLNKPEDQEEIEEDRQKLIQDIIEYQRFKEIQEALKTYQISRQQIFIKKPSNMDEFIVDIDDSRLDGHSSLATLITTLRRMFERVYAKDLRQAKIHTVKLTSAQQEVFIREVFGNRDEVEFEEIFIQPSLTHFVITLMALLDLANKQFLELIQKEEFGPIRIIRKRVINNEE